MEDYLTVLDIFETENEIKRSRFLNFVYHVEDEADVDQLLGELRKKYYKATHVCWAYVLNTTPKRQKSSDDGEPSGTAGKPILDAINFRELTDVLVAVVRFFGGIKLGTGGLIRAYSSGAGKVLNSCHCQKAVFRRDHVTIDYSAYGALSNALQEMDIQPAAENFGENVTLLFFISVHSSEAFSTMITDKTNGTATIEFGQRECVTCLLKNKP